MNKIHIAHMQQHEEATRQNSVETYHATPCGGQDRQNGYELFKGSTDDATIEKRWMLVLVVPLLPAHFGSSR